MNIQSLSMHNTVPQREQVEFKVLNRSVQTINNDVFEPSFQGVNKKALIYTVMGVIGTLIVASLPNTINSHKAKELDPVTQQLESNVKDIVKPYIIANPVYSQGITDEMIDEALVKNNINIQSPYAAKIKDFIQNNAAPIKTLQVKLNVPTATKAELLQAVTEFLDTINSTENSVATLGSLEPIIEKYIAQREDINNKYEPYRKSAVLLQLALMTAVAVFLGVKTEPVNKCRY